MNAKSQTFGRESTQLRFCQSSGHGSFSAQRLNRDILQLRFFISVFPVPQVKDLLKRLNLRDSSTFSWMAKGFQNPQWGLTESLLVKKEDHEFPSSSLSYSQNDSINVFILGRRSQNFSMAKLNDLRNVGDGDPQIQTFGSFQMKKLLSIGFLTSKFTSQQALPKNTDLPMAFILWS